MKTRVTFRVADDLADALRELPNQTHFVETVLRDALGLTCPTCAGTGRLPHRGTALVPNFRDAELPRLDRDAALQLRSLVQLARRVAATRVELSHPDECAGFTFTLRREHAVLLAGRLRPGAAHVELH